VNFLRLFGRLAPGADVQQAQAELSAISRSLRQQFPVEYARKEGVGVVALSEAIVGDARPSLLLLLGAVVVVLATAVANLVSLALVRASGRRPELSMRRALGASRLGLARQLGAEAFLLAAAGCGLGWLLAAQAVGVAALWVPASLPRLEEMGLDAALAPLVVLLAVVVTGLLTAPPLAALARGEADGPRAVVRGTIGDRLDQRVRKAMVVSEISAALVLVLAAIVLVQNLVRLRDLHPGFHPNRVFQARVSLPPAYLSPADLARFAERLSDLVAEAPGVEQVGLVSIAPMSGVLASVPFSVEGQEIDERDLASAHPRVITPAYPSTVGTRLLEGRWLAETDRADTPPVALVSAALAGRFLAQGALGRRIRIDDNDRGPRPVEIVGVLEDVRHTALDLPPPLDVYLPLRQVHPDGAAFVRNNQFWMVRTATDPQAFRATFLERLRAADPDAAVSDTGTMRDFLDAWLGPRRFVLGLVSAFALSAVLLAVSGVYGLVSYAVSQRAREIGLRMAIGATRGDVRWMILRQAGALALGGAAAGLALAGAARPLLAGLVQEASIQPALVLATTLLLIGIVLVAAWAPARRASRIDPTLALRAD
jgi:predicted permease